MKLINPTSLAYKFLPRPARSFQLQMVMPQRVCWRQQFCGAAKHALGVRPPILLGSFRATQNAQVQGRRCIRAALQLKPALEAPPLAPRPPPFLILLREMETEMRRWHT